MASRRRPWRQWREAFLAACEEGLKKRQEDLDEGQGRRERQVIADLAMENELLTRRIRRTEDEKPYLERWSSFVTLLRDKAVDTRGLDPEKAVGTRLSFRQPPPLDICTDQFLFYLRSRLAQAAYQAWASLTPEPVSDLPPERFVFEVHAI